MTLTLGAALFSRYIRLRHFGINFEERRRRPHSHGGISARVNGEDTNTMNQEESEDIVAFDEQGPSFSEPYVSLRHANETMTLDERRKKRLQRKVKEEHGRKLHGGSGGSRVASDALTDGRFAEMLTKNEDELLKFVAQVNKVL